ncbi:transporter substrate-binding domain-containing protein [Aestuariivirga sp.]|uniref:transporter substrate-binding domain-containing protein n=1 Tax=Aestuariivirga sp. TaxID=2650926 RepID=UPI0039E36AE8
MWRAEIRAVLCLAALCCALILGAAAEAQQAIDPAKDLAIGTKVAPPFAMKGDDGQWTGLSIDLWKKIAEQLQLKYHFVEEPDIGSLIAGVENKKYDAAIAAITVTAEREQRMEFSLPYYQSGLGIAVPANGPAIWHQVAQTLLSFGFLKAVGTLIGSALLVGLLIWLFERKHNTDFGGHPVKGIGTSMWWSAEAMTQASTGQLGPKTLPGRVLAIFWMVASIIAIAVFTASVTSALTAGKLQGLIHDSSDLPDVRVGTVQGSAAVDYMTANRIKARLYPTIDDGLKALDAGTIDAFVYDKPLLSWMVLHRNSTSIEVLSDGFEPQAYSIAFPVGSPYRRPVSITTLQTIESPWWRDTNFQYLGNR